MHLWAGHPEVGNYEVYLDGDPMPFAVDANDEEGWLVTLLVWATDQVPRHTPRYVLTDEAIGGRRFPLVRELHGEVTFRRLQEGERAYDQERLGYDPFRKNDPRWMPNRLGERDG